MPIKLEAIMARFNLAKMSLKDMLALQEQLEQAIRDARERERAALKDELVALAAERGFSLSDVVGNVRAKGSKGAVKYRNPDNPAETWSGRGRKPLWLVAKLNKRGAKIVDFAI